jgi:hypothetical protein
MAFALNLPTGDEVSRHTVAAHALAVAGYGPPDPMTVLNTEGSAATDLVCALVDQIDGLDKRFRPGGTKDLAAVLVDGIDSAEVGAMSSELDDYVRPSGEQTTPEDGPTGAASAEDTQRAQLRTLAARVVHAIVAKLDA